MLSKSRVYKYLSVQWAHILERKRRQGLARASSPTRNSSCWTGAVEGLAALSRRRSGVDFRLSPTPARPTNPSRVVTRTALVAAAEACTSTTDTNRRKTISFYTAPETPQCSRKNEKL